MSIDRMAHISEILGDWELPEMTETQVPGEHLAAGQGRWWRLVAVGALMAVLLGALGFLMWPDGGTAATSSAVPAAPVVPAPVQSQAPASTVVPVPRPVDDLRRGLEAWGRFAVSGDVGVLDPWFSPGGPQLEHLLVEAAGLVADPIGGDAYEFLLEDPEVVVSTPGNAVVRSWVTLNRLGERQQRYLWDLELRWSDDVGRWQVWTVRSKG